MIKESFNEEINKEGKDGGFKGLFRGNLANVLKIAPESAVKFSTYETLKKQFKNEEGELTVSRRFFAGALAGVAAHVSMYPLEGPFFFFISIFFIFFIISTLFLFFLFFLLFFLFNDQLANWK